MARGGKREGAGRKSGVPNKITADLKAAIMQAFENVGGSDYLTTLAGSHPQVYCALLGKVLPTALAGADGEGPVELWYKWRESSKSTAATSPAPSSSHTMNGSNGSALGLHTDGPGKLSPTSRN